jgi:hypothetical protein
MSKLLCGYYNETPKIQVIRIEKSAQMGLERVVFPWSWLLFEAEPGAELAIYSDGHSASPPIHCIACQDLQIKA